MEPEPDIEITGDSDAWFAFLEAGMFARRWADTEQAIALEMQRIREDVHREPLLSAQWPTHGTLPMLDASES
jgi:hypothetical protein